MTAQYDHPDYLIIREAHKSGTMSMTAAGTALVGSTLKSYTKFEVLGATVVIGSGASVGSATPKTLGIGRLGAAGTMSSFQKFTVTISATSSAAGQVFDLSLSTPATVPSTGESVIVYGSSATIADHGCVLSDVIWRYRILPFAGTGASGA